MADRADHLRTDGIDVPHPDRFDPETDGYSAAMEAHRAAVVGGGDGYLDPTSGLFVMTAVYLHRRGWCCDRGCRHCPYVGADADADVEEKS